MKNASPHYLAIISNLHSLDCRTGGQWCEKTQYWSVFAQRVTDSGLTTDKKWRIVWQKCGHWIGFCFHTSARCFGQIHVSVKMSNVKHCVNLLCHNWQKAFRGVQGSALYLLAGIVGAESHLGHLHLEVIAPFSSALWEPEHQNQKQRSRSRTRQSAKCVFEKKSTCFDLSLDLQLWQTCCDVPAWVFF